MDHNLYTSACINFLFLKKWVLCTNLGLEVSFLLYCLNERFLNVFHGRLYLLFFLRDLLLGHYLRKLAFGPLLLPGPNEFIEIVQAYFISSKLNNICADLSFF